MKNTIPLTIDDLMSMSPEELLSHGYERTSIGVQKIPQILQDNSIEETKDGVGKSVNVLVMPPKKGRFDVVLKKDGVFDDLEEIKKEIFQSSKHMKDIDSIAYVDHKGKRNIHIHWTNVHGERMISMYFITYDLIPYGQTRDLQGIDISRVKSTTIICYKTTKGSEIVSDYHGVIQTIQGTTEKFAPKEQKAPNTQYHTNRFDGEIGVPLPDSKFRDGKRIPRDK